MAAGGTAMTFGLDVAKSKEVDALAAATVEAYGGIDVWVNNAGGSPLQVPLLQLPRAEWDATFALNLTAIFAATRAAAAHMGEGGRIVNISSLAAEMVIPGSGHYGAAKAGVNMLTQVFAQELGPRIRVNCVMPGAVPTEIMMKAMKLTEADLPRLEKALRLPAGRLGTPRDLGAAVLYLASPASEWVTGQCIRVSGGP